MRGGIVLHRYGLGSWQRGREVIWSKMLTALQVPIYLTIHGKGIGEPGAGRWLDSNTFVFNESVVANEEGLRQIEFVLEGLGIDLITTHSPGWVETTNDGNWGTSHADMFVMVPDHRDLHSFPTRRSSDLVLGWSRNQYLAKCSDSLGAPAAAPDLLDLVEIGRAHV